MYTTLQIDARVEPRWAYAPGWAHIGLMFGDVGNFGVTCVGLIAAYVGFAGLGPCFAIKA